MASVATWPSTVSFQCLYSVGIDFEGDGRRSDSLFHEAKFTTILNARSNSWYKGDLDAPIPQGQTPYVTTASDERSADRDSEERRGGVPPARLSRRERGRDRVGARDDQGQSLLLLQEQGRDSLRLPRVLARQAAGADGRRAGRGRVAGSEAAPAGARLRPPDSRRPARHGADARSRSAVAAALQARHRQARSVRSRHPRRSSSRASTRACSGPAIRR